MHWGVGKNRILDQHLASSRAANAATARCYQHDACGKLVTRGGFVDGGR